MRPILLRSIIFSLTTKSRELSLQSPKARSKDKAKLGKLQECVKAEDPIVQL